MEGVDAREGEHTVYALLGRHLQLVHELVPLVLLLLLPLGLVGAEVEGAQVEPDIVYRVVGG